MYVNHAKGAIFFTCNAIREKKILAKISEFTVTFLYSYFESGPMDQMLCIDFCFLALMVVLFSRKTSGALLPDCLIRNICVKLFLCSDQWFRRCCLKISAAVACHLV